MTSLPKNLIHAAASRLVLNFAAMVFIGVTFFLSWQADVWHSLFGLRGIVFLIGGLVISGGIIGSVSTRLHHSIAAIIVSRSESKSDSVRASMVQWAGTIVLVAQLLLIYYLTAWAFESWIAMPSA